MAYKKDRLSGDKNITLTCSARNTACRQGAPPAASEARAYARGGLAPSQARRVIDYINEDLTRDLTLNVLAALCGLSPFHFARAFRESVGTPPHAYVIARRLARARQLLTDTDLQITEIALMTGYAESGHLARAFRRAFGEAPGDVRRRC